MILAVTNVNSYGSGAPQNFCQFNDLQSRNVVLRPGHNAPPRNPARHNYQIEVGQFNGETVRGRNYIQTGTCICWILLKRV